MLMGINRFGDDLAVGLMTDFLGRLTIIDDQRAMRLFMDDVTRDLGFEHFTLVTHEDLRVLGPARSVSMPIPKPFPTGSSVRQIIAGIQ